MIENPHIEFKDIRNTVGQERYNTWKEGFDTLKSWLFDMCDKHSHICPGVGRSLVDVKHYQCPACMKELQQEEME
jgi:hypothetical protein